MNTGSIQERMATLARDLQGEASEANTLTHVVEAAVEMIGPCQSAGITFVTRKGEVTTTAATDDLPARADELQQLLGEGPCLDAVWGADLVSVPHLDREPRWPHWGPQAVEELGVRSMVCVRLFTNEGQLGALNLFSSHDAAFAPADLDEALAVAAHAAVAMAAASEIKGLGTAVDNRTVLGQATGLVMAQYQVTATQAFNLLRRLSSEQNRKVADLATSLVDAHHAQVDPK